MQTVYKYKNNYKTLIYLNFVKNFNKNVINWSTKMGKR